MILFNNPITLTVLEVSSAVPIAVAKAVVFSFTVVRSDEPPPPPPPPPPDAVFSLIAAKRSRTEFPVEDGSLVDEPMLVFMLFKKA